MRTGIHFHRGLADRDGYSNHSQSYMDDQLKESSRVISYKCISKSALNLLAQISCNEDRFLAGGGGGEVGGCALYKGPYGEAMPKRVPISDLRYLHERVGFH